MGLEDLLRVIQLLSGAPLSSDQREQQGQAQLPGGYPTGTGAGTSTSPFSLFNAQAARSASGNTITSAAAARVASTEPLEEDEEMLEIEQDMAPRQQPQDPPTSISRYALDTSQNENEEAKKDIRKEKQGGLSCSTLGEAQPHPFLFFVRHAYYTQQRATKLPFFTPSL